MLYEVLLHSSGGERFTIEREAPLADGDTFEQDSEPYRVLTIQPGYGPFAGVIELVHQLSGGFEGQASDIEIQAHRRSRSSGGWRSGSKRRASTLSMRPYSCTSAAGMK
jgi:hypothetical protein